MDYKSQQFDLFCLLHGQVDKSPLFIGQIPAAVSRTLGWSARRVFVTLKDAQKIRHHPMHGMDAIKGMQLPMVVSHGDYYQSQKRGTELQIEVVLHELDAPKRAYFLVLSRNKEDTGIFIRTFYYNAEIPRSKMRGANRLVVQSGLNYFK